MSDNLRMSELLDMERVLVNEILVSQLSELDCQEHIFGLGCVRYEMYKLKLQRKRASNP